MAFFGLPAARATNPTTLGHYIAAGMRQRELRQPSRYLAETRAEGGRVLAGRGRCRERPEGQRREAELPMGDCVD